MSIHRTCCYDTSKMTSFMTSCTWLSQLQRWRLHVLPWWVSFFPSWPDASPGDVPHRHTWNSFCSICASLLFAANDLQDFSDFLQGCRWLLHLVEEISKEQRGLFALHRFLRQDAEVVCILARSRASRSFLQRHKGRPWRQPPGRAVQWWYTHPVPVKIYAERHTGPKIAEVTKCKELLLFLNLFHFCFRLLALLLPRSA